MKLALLTCTNLPDWEQDDRFFHQFSTLPILIGHQWRGIQTQSGLRLMLY